MIEVNIKKPLYGSFVYVRESVLQLAVKRGGKIKITIPKGSAVHDAREWMKTGKQMQKVFLRPDEPMILWGNNVLKPDTEVLQKRLF